VLAVQNTLLPTLREWGGQHLQNVHPSGSFAKGTANHSGTDIDLFLSVEQNVPNAMKQIYDTLFNKMNEKEYSPRRQNVSINVKVGGYSVDLVPAKRQDSYSGDHSLYRRRADTWTKTNVITHIARVSQSGCVNEIRILKLWRDQKALDFPSFYLELTAISAVGGTNGTLSQRIWAALQYLQDRFANARVIDPANTNNVISDDLNDTERARITAAASTALTASDWSQIVK
jgi:hypothetical protein